MIPPPIRLCNNLTIPSLAVNFLHFRSLFILCWPQQILLKKHGIAPKSGKNNGNCLRTTLITLRASSYSPVHDIKNQDDFLRQGEQLHTYCIMKVSKVNCMIIK